MRLPFTNFLACSLSLIAAIIAMYTVTKLEYVYRQKLGDDICRYGLCIRQCDANVVSLKIKQSNIELEMSNLGGINSADSVMLLCCCNGLALCSPKKI